MDILFQVTICSVDEFFTPKHTVPDEISRATPAFFRVFFALVVEVQADLGVNTDPKVVVHDTLLVEIVPVRMNEQNNNGVSHLYSTYITYIGQGRKE